jgi:hypothetical protein
LLIRIEEGLDLRLGIVEGFLQGLALGVHLLLHGGHLLQNDRFDLGFLIVGQCQSLGEAIKDGVGPLGGIGLAVWASHHAAHSEASAHEAASAVFPVKIARAIAAAPVMTAASVAGAETALSTVISTATAFAPPSKTAMSVPVSALAVPAFAGTKPTPAFAVAKSAAELAEMMTAKAALHGQHVAATPATVSETAGKAMAVLMAMVMNNDPNDNEKQEKRIQREAEDRNEGPLIKCKVSNSGSCRSRRRSGSWIAHRIEVVEIRFGLRVPL